MKPKKLIIAGACLFVLAILFGFLTTVYFIYKDGFHVLPSTIAELTCDNITFFLMIIGGCSMVLGLGKLINEVKPH